jgi:MYXO-CTERM domain-containing protein
VTAYIWAYRPPNGTEDWSHSNLDIQGIYRAYATGKYGITDAEMLPLANTFLEVIRRGPGDYAGRVDGTDGGGNSSPTTYVRPGWYVAALFRPADYLTIVSEDLSEGGTTSDITRFANFLWVKCKLHPDDCVLPEVPPGDDTADAGIDGGGEADAGETGADAGQAAHDGEVAGCGCRVGGRGGVPPCAPIGALVLVAIARRTRRRR